MAKMEKPVSTSEQLAISKANLVVTENKLASLIDKKSGLDDKEQELAAITEEIKKRKEAQALHTTIDQTENKDKEEAIDSDQPVGPEKIIETTIDQTEGEKHAAGLETELALLIQKKNHTEEHSKAKNKDALLRKFDREIDRVSKELNLLLNKTPGGKEKKITEPILEIIPAVVPKEILEKVEQAREKYIKEYNNCKKEADKQKLIQKTKNSILNLFKSKENKTPIKTEDYFTDKLTESKKEFDQARIEMGNVMFEQKKSELEKAGLSGKDLENALINYRATEILSKTIIEERQKIIDAKAEKSPLNPGKWKKLWEGYQKLPKWKRVALSTLLFMPVAAVGAMGASAIAAGGVVAGLGSLAAVKFGVSMGLGTVSAYSAKGIDYLKRNSDAKFNEKINYRKQAYQNELAKGSLGLEEYEKGMADIENEEKKHNRNRVLLKAGVGIAIAGAAGFAAYDVLGNGLHHLPVGHGGVDASHLKTGSSSSAWPDNAKPGAGNSFGPASDSINKPEGTIWPQGNKPGFGVEQHQTVPASLITHAPVEATADHGQGAISTIRELQHNLKAEYGNNLDNAPASVKHILNTDPHKLAQEYGMYKPGQDAESALIKSGSTFRVDESGNVTYHPVVGHDVAFEKGIEVKASNVYEGRMVDTDHSGIKIENTQHYNPDVTVQQVDPVTGESILNTPHYDSNSLNGDQFNAPQQIDAITGKPMETSQINPDVYQPGINNSPISTSPDHLNPAKDLSVEDLKQVQETYTSNIKHLFPSNESMAIWSHMKETYAPADNLIRLSESGQLNPVLQPLADHIHKLEEVTGLKPEAGLGDIKPPETISHFMNRATEVAKYTGKLNEVKVGNVSPIIETPHTGITHHDVIANTDREHIGTVELKEGGANAKIIFKYNGDGEATGYHYEGTYTGGENIYDHYNIDNVPGQQRVIAISELKQLDRDIQFLEKIPKGTHEYNLVQNNIAIQQQTITEQFGKNIIKPEDLLKVNLNY